jgi:phage terminase large subunit-like protein
VEADDPAVQAALAEMTDADVLSELLVRVSHQKLSSYAPYAYQREFHAAGAQHPERLLMAGNRVGKTHGACAEDACHLSGLYPDWWEGKRFPRAIKAWVVSITNETSRDILQAELLGEPIGTGMIPFDRIEDVTYRQAGIGNVVDSVAVKHAEGGISSATFRNYEQGWRKFQGTAMDVIHMDEEPDDFKLYTECRTRIVTRGGVMYTTMTPLLGETTLVQRFKEYVPGTFMLTASMAECPHLEGRIDDILAQFPAHERDARMNGQPIVGEGRVFAYPDGDIVSPPISIPDHWARIVGIDFGINKDHQQACAWLAHDRDTDTVYLYDEYKAPEHSIVSQCDVLKMKGKWIPVAWPHDGAHREKSSGIELRNHFLERDVSMISMPACYSSDRLGAQPVEPIVAELCERIESSRFKVFPQCRKFLDEFRGLHRKNGVIQQVRDDLVKAVFCALMMLRFAATDKASRPQKAPAALRAWGNA